MISVANIGNNKIDLKEKLNMVKFIASEEPHIKIIAKVMCKKCKHKPCVYVCPAENFKLENNELLFNCGTCFECGACRIICPHHNLDWSYPKAGFGVFYSTE